MSLELHKLVIINILYKKNTKIRSKKKKKNS
jgi:hypothetical protein